MSIGGVVFYVDGTTIPEVDFDVGPSWAGLLPISGDKDETRKVSVLFIYSIRRWKCCMLIQLCSCSFGSSRLGRRGATIR